MPIYEFKCTDEKCGKVREILMRSPEYAPGHDRHVQCIECGKRAERIWSVPSEAKVQGGTPKFY